MLSGGHCGEEAADAHAWGVQGAAVGAGGDGGRLARG